MTVINLREWLRKRRDRVILRDERTEDAALICFVLRGCVATDAELVDDMERLGVYWMTDAQYAAWRTAMQPECERSLEKQGMTSTKMWRAVRTKRCNFRPA
jgi:hypothetical protein